MNPQKNHLVRTSIEGVNRLAWVVCK